LLCSSEPTNRICRVEFDSTAIVVVIFAELNAEQAPLFIRCLSQIKSATDVANASAREMPPGCCFDLEWDAREVISEDEGGGGGGVSLATALVPFISLVYPRDVE